MDISIIIPALNEEKNIGKLLFDIKAQTIYGKNIEVIVADGGSKDRTKEIAQDYGAKIVLGGLPSIARNSGAKISKGNMLYFMDSDIHIRSTFLEGTYEEFHSRNLDVAGMDNYNMYEGDQKVFEKISLEIAGNLANKIFRMSEFIGKPKAVGTCMVFDKNAFLDSNGFKENIYWGEDTEIAQRMKKDGYNFGILRSEGIYTHPRKQVTQGILKYYINVVKLNNYRNKTGEVTSKELYQKITGIEDYFRKK